MVQPAPKNSVRAGVGKRVAAFGVVAVVLTGIGLGISSSSVKTVTTPATVLIPATIPIPVPAGCLPDPTQSINSTLTGQTWNGQGDCYLTPNGVNTPVSLTNATFYDLTPYTGGKSTHSLGMKPIIEVKTTDGISLTDLHLYGSDTAGTFKAGAVGQAGVDVRSSSNLTISNVWTNQTWGDGLTLFLVAGKSVTADNDITVNGLTVTLAGRDGISPADVTNSTFSNIDIVSAKDSAMDFESDIPSVADSALTFTNITAHGGLNIIQKVGSVSFTNTNDFGPLYVDSSNAAVDYQGSFTCARSAPKPCIEVKAGTLTFTGTTTLGHVSGSSKITNTPYEAVAPGVINGLPDLEVS